MDSACAGCYNSSWYQMDTAMAQITLQSVDMMVVTAAQEIVQMDMVLFRFGVNCIDPNSADLAEGGQCYVAPPQ